MAEQQNITLVQKLYAAFSTGDIQTILNNLGPNAEWINHGPATVPYMGNFTGRAPAFFQAMGESTAEGKVIADRFIAQGDSVVSTGRYTAKVRRKIRYGLIPEFVGRLPVAGVMNDLDKPALVRILTEPKNALLKQYQRLFEFENVRLRFTDDALATVAELALQRKVGARGLRMILEDLMLEVMYHLPMQRKVRDFVVTEDMVRTREINWSLLEKAG